jgi:hypothetical protein
MQGHILVITAALLRKEALASSLFFWKGGLATLQAVLEQSAERMQDLEEAKPKGAFKGARGGARAHKTAASEKEAAETVHADMTLLASASQLLEATFELTPSQSSELTVGVERVEAEAQRLRLIPLLCRALVQMVRRLERTDRVLAAHKEKRRHPHPHPHPHQHPQHQHQHQEEHPHHPHPHPHPSPTQAWQQQAWQRERSQRREKDRSYWSIMHRRSLLSFVDGYTRVS